MMIDLKEMLTGIKVLPVLTLHSEAEALCLCAALRAAGIRGVEITLRSDAAFQIIRWVKQQMPDFLVGAGTVTNCEQLERLADIGADFAVSPGIDERLSQHADERELAYLPGIATATELMQGLAMGRRTFKLFPAEAVGGIKLLKAFAGPFAKASFCPTGGVSADNYLSYLSQNNVVCVGGSWMVPGDDLKQKQWASIEQAARALMESLADEH